MMFDDLRSVVLRPPLTGSLAIFCGVVAIGVPTAIRAAVDGLVSGCELTVYLPFVLLVAILAGWKHAAAVTVFSGLVADMLILGPHHSPFSSACTAYSLTVFAISSAALIGFVQALRRVIRGHVEMMSAREGGIVFSLEKGEAWASWYGGGAPVQLGRQHDVAEMMKDFLAQLELGRRLDDADR